MADRSELIFKAKTFGPEILEPQSKQETDRQNAWADAGAIAPPYDPESMAEIFEISNSLRPNVDAYAVNIDGFGHHFEPAIDLEQEDSDQVIADAMFLERIHEMESEGSEVDDDYASIADPTDDEIADRKKKLERVARVEKARLTAFFDFAAQDQSFPSLRKKTRQDLETTGQAYWEVLRNKKGKIARFVYIPAWTMRLCKLIPEPVQVQEPYRISPIKLGKINVRRKFRKYVQILDDGARTYFKEFGDPRIVSRQTGRVYRDQAEFKAKAEKDDTSANEVIHFKIHSSRSPYGIPRWTGAAVSALGSRASEEVNYLYFENKAVPPLAILVSGGRLATKAHKEIEDFIENRIKGKRNFHKILLIEAVGPASKDGATPQRPVIEIKPLMDAMLKDALFQNYDMNNIDKVGSSFRLPRLLRGEARDFNRATAEASLRYAEAQIFQPERDDFDYFINWKLMPLINATYWRFRSNSPIATDPQILGKLVVEMVKHGVLTPHEGRMLAGDIFNREFTVLHEAWTKQPITFTLAGIQTGQQGAPLVTEPAQQVEPAAKAEPGMLVPAQGQPPKIPSITDGQDNEQIVQWLMRIRSEIAQKEAELDKARLLLERKADGVAPDGTLVIEIPEGQMDEWTKPTVGAGGSEGS